MSTKNKNSVIYLKDWQILIQSLPDDKRLIFWDLFANYPDCECEDDMVKPIWNFVKKQIENMDEKYQEKVVERNRENGKKGGRPKNQPITETQENLKNPMGYLETQETLNEKDNENENINDNVNINVSNRKTKVFTPPTIEEVKEYCIERKNSVNANKFVDFYQSKNWMVGKNKMKDWKACVRTWEAKEEPKKEYQPKKGFHFVIN